MSILVALFAVCSSVGQGAGGQSATLRITGTYTNMAYNKEGGDLGGEELKIVMTQGGEYQGALQFAEGEPGTLMVVDIKVVENRISFSVPDADIHAGQFDGVVEDGVLHGQFRFKRGGSDTVTLKRGKSYWD